VEGADVKIAPFAVEQWMNAHEERARFNMGETCVESLTLGELLALDGDPDAALAELRALQLTYGHILGAPELRRRVAALYADLEPGQTLITNGAIGANYLVQYALIEPGDRVVCVQPTYQQLWAVPASFGAEVVPLPLRPEAGWLPDLDELKGLLARPTAMVVVNNPNNPSGALMDGGFLEELVRVVRESGAWLLADEVYRGLEHDGRRTPSVVDLYERGLSTGSMSKVYALAGLRVGWIAGPRAAIDACVEHRDYTTISVGQLDEALATIALRSSSSLLERNLAIVRRDLAIVDEWVAGEPRLSYVRPRAGTTAFVHYDYDLPSAELCERLFQADGAFVVPGSAFGREGYFRLGYAFDAGRLTEGLTAVSSFLRTLEA
jgi:aspartate/methionine/tyrosine aminotransferase